MIRSFQIKKSPPDKFDASKTQSGLGARTLLEWSKILSRSTACLGSVVELKIRKIVGLRLRNKA